MRKLLPILFGVLILLGLSGCEHKDLCYHHDHRVRLQVLFDWRDAPDASPNGMAVFFYPENGGEWYRFDFANIHGGEVSVPAGRYSVICYNNDTPGVFFQNTDTHSSHTAYTRESGLFEVIGQYGRADVLARIPRADGAEDERVMLCPDELWGCQALEVEVDEQGVRYICVPESEKDLYDGPLSTETLNTITLYPHELTCVYTYEIRNVENLGEVNNMSASLSGMSSTLRLHDEELGLEAVTLPFAASVGSDGHTIVGKFITFGHHPSNSKPHRMMLYVWTKAGSFCYGSGTGSEKFDVTSQVDNAPNRRRVHFIIDGLTIPSTIDDAEGGFKPGVFDWNQEDYEIRI